MTCSHEAQVKWKKKLYLFNIILNAGATSAALFENQNALKVSIFILFLNISFLIRCLLLHVSLSLGLSPYLSYFTSYVF